MVYRVGLENRSPREGTGGSNPSLSADTIGVWCNWSASVTPNLVVWVRVLAPLLFPSHHIYNYLIFCIFAKQRLKFMDEKLQKNIDLLNRVAKEGMLPMLCANLISSDSMTSAEACAKAEGLLKGFAEAIPYTDIEKKDEWERKFLDGVMIARRDREEFEKQQ